jgi:RNA recognition motif-containing protein
VKNIFVGNLSFNTNEDELRQAFESYGEKAIAALNGSQLGGRTINVNEARPKAERVGGGGGGRERGGRSAHRDRW